MGFIHIPAGIWLNIGLDPFWHTCVVAGKSYRAVHALLLDQSSMCLLQCFAVGHPDILR